MSPNKNSWQTKILGELLDIQNGFAFDSKKFSKVSGVPLIRIRDLKNGFKTETNYLGSYKADYEVKKGDFLVGMDGEFGCYEWKGPNALLNQRVCRLKDFKGISPKFLFYEINKYLKEIEESTGYTTVKHISSGQILAIRFSFPSFKEQKRIVKILDVIIKNIDRAKANIENNLKSSKELFNSYLQSVFANPKSNWIKENIGKTSNVIAGQSPEGKFYNKIAKGIPFYQGKREFGEKYIGRPTTWTLKITKQAQKGDVLMSVRAPVGPINFAVEKICIGRGLAAIRAGKDIDKVFLFYCLLSKEKEIVGNAGAVFASINKADIENLVIYLPSLSEQRKVIKKLDELSKQTKKLEENYRQKLLLLDELKKSVLQKAFAGEL